ncbi:thioester domain-containing protein [Bacillus sp. 18-5]|uniref:thioester domain-containing protein n=1 Tax=Bacillus sp. 18-5 TaxID=3458701 RepID=UPI004045E557
MGRQNIGYSFAITTFSIVLTVLFLFSNADSAAAARAEAKGPYSWTDPGGITHSTALIKIGDNIVFCIDPDIPAPYGGHNYKSGERQYDDAVKAILYYGYGGDGNELGNTMTDMVKTYVALNNWKSGKRTQSTYSNQDKEVWSLIQHAKRGDAPSYQVSFQKKNLKTTLNGENQKSEVNKLQGKGSVTLELPKEVTININGNKKTGGKVTIKDGQSFYFTAPLNYGSTFKTGNVNGKYNELASLLYMPNSTNYQRLMGSVLVVDPIVSAGFSVEFEKRQSTITIEHRDIYDNTLLESKNELKTIGTKYKYQSHKEIKKNNNVYVPVKKEIKEGTVGVNNKKIVFYYNLKRDVTVLHKDNRDKRLLKKEVFSKLRGEKYSYGPKTNLKKGEYTYRPIKSDKVEGQVGSKNITITFFYDVPLIKLELKKLQIYTAKANTGLPVKVHLGKVNIYPNDTPGMNDANMNLNLYQGEQKLASKEFTAKDIPKLVEFKIESKNLKINSNKPYTVKLEGFNQNDIDVLTNASSLTTHGFTSSERVITATPEENTRVSEKAVVMTEITPTTKEKRYYEIIRFVLSDIPTMKTGYGFEKEFEYTYQNEIGQKFRDGDFHFNVPSKLIDSYLKYDKSRVPFEKIKETSENEGDVITTTSLYALPKVYVERMTGNLFSSKDNDPRLKHELIDGGRKFYLPIWLELGDYKVITESNKLGVNQVMFEIYDNINVKASMYATKDSETIDEDEILLHPVNGDNPFPSGLPDGWTIDDIKWITK